MLSCFSAQDAEITSDTVARVATATKKKHTTLSIQRRLFSSVSGRQNDTLWAETLLTLIRQLLGTPYGPYHSQMTPILTSQSA